MNSVEPDRIVHVEAPGKPYRSGDQPPTIGRILVDLGYKNSDILFYDKLIIVEGKTDKAILQILLGLGGISQDDLTRVGFPILEGAPEGLRNIQRAILKYEKLIGALCQSDIPRVYLLDGDRCSSDKTVLGSMRNPSNGSAVRIKFLPRAEIENYLLVPAAVEAALREEAELADVSTKITAEEVDRKINELLESDDPKLFPDGKGSEPARKVKASLLLQRLYESCGNLVYDKDRSGILVAHHIREEEQPALRELRELVSDIVDVRRDSA